MAKIIHASQMLETPQINILNDNVIDSVNYSYNETTMPFSKLGSFDFSGYLLLTNEDTEEQEITPVYNNSEYNPNITNLSLTNTSRDDGTFRITETYLSFNYIFNYSGNLINPSTFILQNEKYTFIEDKKEGGNVGVNTRELEGGVTYEIVNIDTNNEIIKLKFKVLLKRKYIHKAGTITVPAGSEWSTLYYNTFNADFYANKITTSSVENNENSEFTLESNELIQHNTAIYNMQISKYIAGNIKTLYKDGKATISMQVIDDGAEYDVNDIIQPMKTKSEFVTDIFEPQLLSRPIIDEVFTYPILLFKLNNKFFIVLAQPNVTNEIRVYSSTNGTSWKLESNNIISIIKSVSTTGWKVWYANNKVFIYCRSQYESHVIYTEDGKNYKLVHTFYTLGSADGVVYYKDYYYMKVDDGKLYRFTLSDYITTELINTFDCTYGVISVFRDKLYIIGKQSSLTFVATSSDGNTFQSTILNYNGTYNSYAHSSTHLIISSSGSGGVLITSDGESWTQNTTAWGMNIEYDNNINAFMVSTSGRTQISYDNGINWETLISDGGNFYEYNDNCHIYMYVGNRPQPFKFYAQGYKDIEYPLLTNQDGTPKTFEITSSELVFDGRSYYNIDAVEVIDISKEQFTYTISWTTGGQLDSTNKVIITDSEGTRYYNGDTIKGGTIVTVSFNADSGDKLNYLKVNGVTITDGSTLVVYEDVVISYSYDAPRDYLDESDNPIDEMGFGFAITQTSGLQDVIYNPRSNELYGVLEIGIPSYNGMEFEPLITLNASNIKFNYASYDGGSGDNYLAINMNTDTIQINMNLSSSTLYQTNLSVRFTRYLTISSVS